DEPANSACAIVTTLLVAASSTCLLGVSVRPCGVFSDGSTLNSVKYVSYGDSFSSTVMRLPPTMQCGPAIKPTLALPSTSSLSVMLRLLELLSSPGPSSPGTYHVMSW